MLCRAAFTLGIARSAWVRERVYALLCRSYADELSPLTDASIRDNATMLLKDPADPLNIGMGWGTGGHGLGL